MDTQTLIEYFSNSKLKPFPNLTELTVVNNRDSYSLCRPRRLQCAPSIKALLRGMGLSPAILPEYWDSFFSLGAAVTFVVNMQGIFYSLHKFSVLYLLFFKSGNICEQENHTSTVGKLYNYNLPYITQVHLPIFGYRIKAEWEEHLHGFPGAEYGNPKKTSVAVLLQLATVGFCLLAP